MRKPCTVLCLLTVVVFSKLCYSVPVRKATYLKAQLNPFYLKAMAAYKKLEAKLPREELRAITTIGILNGAKQAEQQMEQNLIEVIKDLLWNTNMNDTNLVLPKIEKIEDQLERDRKALEILTKSFDMATKAKDAKKFKQEMLDILNDVKEPAASDSSNETDDGDEKIDMGKRVAQLRKQILKQMDLMKNVVDNKIDFTLEYLIDHAEAEGPLAKASGKVLKKRQTSVEEPARVTQIKSTLTEDDFRNNLVEMSQPNNKDSFLNDDNHLTLANNVIERNSTYNATKPVFNVVVNVTDDTAGALNDTKPAKQEDGSPEFDDDDDDAPPAGGGGLVGLIASLSGGEGGSDIGALIGALTGVISQIFGPNGLDIETLISSATALIAGLLAGEKNFGTVLGIYVGTAFDGLSGGGGADLNGQFVGNLLGTIVASLSADPEEDGVPPKPLLFLKNFLNSFIEAKNRPLDDESEESAERKESNNNNHSHKDGSSDSSAFIQHVVSHIVGGIVSLILNASVGASGGSSQASSSIFSSSSSSKMHPPPPETKG